MGPDDLDPMLRNPSGDADGRILRHTVPCTDADDRGCPRTTYVPAVKHRERYEKGCVSAIDACTPERNSCVSQMNDCALENISAPHGERLRAGPIRLRNEERWSQGRSDRRSAVHERSPSGRERLRPAAKDRAPAVNGRRPEADGLDPTANGRERPRSRAARPRAVAIPGRLSPASHGASAPATDDDEKFRCLVVTRWRVALRPTGTAERRCGHSRDASAHSAGSRRSRARTLR